MSITEKSSPELERVGTRETTVVSQYTIAELAGAAQSLFHTTPDCVTAALRNAGLTRATKAEAQRLIEEFIKAPVSDSIKLEVK